MGETRTAMGDAFTQIYAKIADIEASLGLLSSNHQAGAPHMADVEQTTCPKLYQKLSTL